MCSLSVVVEDEVGIEFRLVLQLVEIIGGEGMRVVMVVAGAMDIGTSGVLQGGHREDGQGRVSREGA